MQTLEQTFRWYGPGDQVSLKAIKQTGATGIVTALHQTPSGEVWEVEDIIERKQMIEKEGLKWSVIESINVHEAIKTGAPDRDQWLEKYLQSLRNVASQDIKLVCYNFMPVLDWTRTDLDYRLNDGASALRFDATSLVVFDLFILNRPGAELHYSSDIIEAAHIRFKGMNQETLNSLQSTVLAGLPGTSKVLTIPEFQAHLDKYTGIDSSTLKSNLAYFLRTVIPVAEDLGIKMCVHPDDPPFNILGLPRILCNKDDLQFLLDSAPSQSNGITFCSGSLGASVYNDLVEMFHQFASHVHFLHLRNVIKEPDGSFFEAHHLNGDNNMPALMEAIIQEQERRVRIGRNDVAIPMRPDHGHRILDDFKYNTFPGYPTIGRLKGLAELRGLEQGIRYTRGI